MTLVVFLLTPVTVPLTHLDYFITLMPNPQVRATLLGVPVFITAMAFAQGRMNAGILLRGERSLFVDVIGSGLQLQSNEDPPVSYVGHVAEFFVLYESARSRVVILNAEKVNSLVLIQNPKGVF
jgi:hypothetical protein